MRFFGLVLLVLLAAGGHYLYANRAMLRLSVVAPTPAGAAARPDLLGPMGGSERVTTLDVWAERRAPALRRLLDDTVYGAFPEAQPVRVLARRIVEKSAFGGRGRVEEVTLATGAGAERIEWPLVLVLPTAGEGPYPTILQATFCNNTKTLEPVPLRPSAHKSPCDSESLEPLMLWVFGEHAARPPVEAILDRGYALATYYGPDVVPDDARLAAAALTKVSNPAPEPENAPGAIAAWAWSMLRALDYLDTDERFDPSATALFGHSRYGKAALLAAAQDARVDLVYALQSGTGGATLSRADAGESVAQITKAYPHWFGREFPGFAGRESALPIDQHALLALIAPRPVLLGNARRDMWSDPAGSFRAAQGASPVYRLFGAVGLDQPDLVTFNAEAQIGFFMRPGGHGITRTDWDRFLEFADLHFGRTGQTQ